jgi:hypothetical protein
LKVLMKFPYGGQKDFGSDNRNTKLLIVRIENAQATLCEEEMRPSTRIFGLDQGVGHLLPPGLAHSSSRRTEGPWR